MISQTVFEDFRLPGVRLALVELQLLSPAACLAWWPTAATWAR